MMPTVDISIHAGAHNMRAQAVRVKNLIIRGEKCSLAKDKTADNMRRSGSLWHYEESLRLSRMRYLIIATRAC